MKFKSKNFKKNILDVEEGSRKATGYFWRFFIMVIEVLFYVVLIVGAISSFLLLYKFYPEMYSRIILLVAPGFLTLIKIIKIAGYGFLLSGSIYLILRLSGFIIKDSHKHRKVKA